MTSAFYSILYLLAICAGTVLFQVLELIYPIIVSQSKKYPIRGRIPFALTAMMITHTLLFAAIIAIKPWLDVPMGPPGVVSSTYASWIPFAQAPCALLISVAITHALRSKWPLAL